MYTTFQMNRALAEPINVWSGLVRKLWSSSSFPMVESPLARWVTSSSEMLERATRRYEKVPFGLETTEVDGHPVPVCEKTVLATPFCNLVRFERDARREDPKVLLVAPLSGHHASLIRETVERLLPEHDVHVTDWIDARLVPVSCGRFDLDDYIDVMQRFMRHLGPDLHVVAVCQPSVPVLAAISLMAEDDDPLVPLSMTLMAGPIDARVAPTSVSRLAMSRPLAWFEWTAVHRVPFGEPGFMRKVYPGFLQLAAFVSMKSARHLNAHRQLYRDLISGDVESADVYRRFYDDYLAVIDLPAEYYLQTVEKVFQRHDLGRGEMMYRGTRRVRPELIRRTALMTIEGANDDITGVGQTAAAHRLCSAIPPDRRLELVVPGVGHYGTFSGRRWRDETAPRLREFIRASA
jgi:poly(3-hydroxybutyrate) depolymerase